MLTELFHLAKDTKDLRQTVLDVLCAHIRQTTSDQAYRDEYTSRPSVEIQSLLTLLFVQQNDIFFGLRISLQDSFLNGADLRKARLWHADLRRSRLNKTIMDGADLHRAVLTQAHLEEAWVEGGNLQEYYSGFDTHDWDCFPPLET